MEQKKELWPTPRFQHEVAYSSTMNLSNGQPLDGGQIRRSIGGARMYLNLM